MDRTKIRKTIEQMLIKEGYEPEEKRHEIAFHLTDWLDDLEAWHSFCAAPDSLESEALEKLIMQFLIHVPNHVAAASKLMLDIPVTDIFEVGATADDD